MLGSTLFCAKAHATTTINFTMPGAYTTSAGVFKTDGTLVRTLWRKVAYSAGSHSESWDDKDDSGSTMPAGNYQVRILYHDVDYVWEGTVGITASSFTGYIRRGLENMSDMASDGDDVMNVFGYNEGQPGLMRFDTSDAQTVTYSNPSCITTTLDYVATDGNRIYMANTGRGINFGYNQSFVFAYNASDNSRYSFTNGTSICQQFGPDGVGCYDEHYFPNVIDKGPGISDPPTGIDVQKSGDILAVSHGTLNLVRLFDKTSGSLLNTISITSPKRIAFAPNGDLWVVSGTTVQRFAESTLGTTNTPATTISSFSAPEDVAVHPSNNNIVMVADAGSSHQIKAYTSSGSSLWTFGTSGGYASSPDVTNSKLGFVANKTYVNILSDGSFWVSDPVNDRAVHFDSSRSYIEQMMYLPTNYMSTSDPNAPTRVLGDGWLEFEVDYSQTLQPGDPTAPGGNNSWRLVKNWGPGAPAANKGSEVAEGLHTVVTLSNGRVYAFARNLTNSTIEVFELPASGNLRYTGVSFSSTATLYPNGDVRDYTISGGTQTVTNRTLTGFDGSGNPIWSSPSTLSSAPAGSGDPHYRGYFTGSTGPRFPTTSTNVVISFDQSVGGSANTGMHLGGMNVSGSQWLWKASPAGSGIDFNDPDQQNGTFDIGSGTQYGGNLVLNNGRNVVYGYHGEFWNNGQANQYVHFWDDGLFVGQFGVPQNNGLPATARIGVAGNAFSPSIVKTKGKTYYWVNDENNHDAIHRWKLDRVNNIAEMIATGALGGTITPTVSVPDAPIDLTATAGDAEVKLDWEASSGAVTYNVYRGTSSNGQSGTPIVTGITGTTYTNTGLTNGITYYYKVKAVNTAGTSANSNEASATPQVAAPAAPSGLTALAGNAQVTLNWSATSGATSYNIYRGTTSSGQSGTPIATGVTATNYVDSGLTNGTTYYYKIKAVNAGGTSPFSNEANATPSSSVASIAYASSAPTIDGTVDSAWSIAPSYNITTVVNGTTTVTGSWKAMWNSSNLYVLATVSDASLLNSNTDYLGDSVEIYIDADNSKSGSYGANDFQYIYGWGDSVVNEYAHSATTGVSYAQANITGGYRMEFAIPWSTLGVTATANDLIGFDVGIDDAATSTSRAGQVMWFGTDNNYVNPSLFGTGKLMP